MFKKIVEKMIPHNIHKVKGTKVNFTKDSEQKISYKQSWETLSPWKTEIKH